MHYEVLGLGHVLLYPQRLIFFAGRHLCLVYNTVEVTFLHQLSTLIGLRRRNSSSFRHNKIIRYFYWWVA